jgi:hypothetical protein
MSNLICKKTRVCRSPFKVCKLLLFGAAFLRTTNLSGSSPDTITLPDAGISGPKVAWRIDWEFRSQVRNFMIKFLFEKEEKNALIKDTNVLVQMFPSHPVISQTTKDKAGKKICK